MGEKRGRGANGRREPVKDSGWGRSWNEGEQGRDKGFLEGEGVLFPGYQVLFSDKETCQGRNFLEADCLEVWEKREWRFTSHLNAKETQRINIPACKRWKKQSSTRAP